MIILINALNFSPEFVGNAKYTSEFVYWLRNKITKVIVITTNPYYPEWKCYSNKYRFSKDKNIRIYRCPIYVPKKINAINKIIHYFSFLLTSFPILIFNIFHNPDIIFTVCPTIFSAPSAIFIKLFAKIFLNKKITLWLHIQDLEIDAAFKLNILKGSYVKKILLLSEKLIFKNYDILSTISYPMINKLKQKIKTKKNIVYFPNFIETSEYKIKYKNREDNPFFKKLNLDPKKKIIMYSGTINEKISYKVFCDTIDILKDKKNIEWIISGDGPRKNLMQERLNKYKNVRFMPFQPINDLTQWLQFADIHLIPQRISAADLLLPSKLLGICASAKPIIGFAKSNSELGKIIEIGGLRVENEDPKQFSKAILKLIKDDARRKKLGLEGEKYIKKFYEKRIVLNKILILLKRI